MRLNKIRFVRVKIICFYIETKCKVQSIKNKGLVGGGTPNQRRKKGIGWWRNSKPMEKEMDWLVAELQTNGERNGLVGGGTPNQRRKKRKLQFLIIQIGLFGLLLRFMIHQNIYSTIKRATKKLFCVLVDPDKHNSASLKAFVVQLNKSKDVDFILVGGSLLRKNNFEKTITFLKHETEIPVIIFPGNAMQISHSADAILLLSLISGRNPEMLIGNHVLAAPLIKEAGLEPISTGYMLIDGGQTTAVQYMSNTMPIPCNKPEIAAATALAGEMLGMKLIYMDAGSGANQPISLEMIEAVKKEIEIPLIIGGGIKDAKTVTACCKAGADIIVVGNLFEEKPELVSELALAMV